MIISPKHKFIFFKPLKTAGSSVEQALLRQCSKNVLCTGTAPLPNSIGWTYKPINNSTEDGLDRFNTHTGPELLFSRLAKPEYFENYRLISMTRNPWDAVVSYFWYNAALHPVWRENIFLQLQKDQRFLYVKELFNEWLIVKTKFRSLWNEKLEEYKSYEYIGVLNEACIDDKVNNYIRFETLQKDFNFICFLLGVEPSALEKLKSGYKLLDNHYSDYYTQESKNMIERAFPKTIKKFGYTFDRRVK